MLVSHVSDARRDEVASVPQLAAMLDGHVADIAAAWPSIYLDVARYLRGLAAAIERRADEPASRVIATMPAGDLYLAAACIAGDPAALAMFREQLVPGLRQALGALAIPPETIDETVQRVLVMLLVGNPPQLAGYTGRGRLHSWLRSVGVRTGRRLAGELHGGAGASANDLDDLPAAMRDPELDMLRVRYADAVRDAFGAALASLTERQRTLLRQYHIDGLTVDQLGALYRVSRSTAQRMVAAARLQIVTATRGRLVDHGIPTDELDSIIRLVRSQLSVSLGRLR